MSIDQLNVPEESKIIIDNPDAGDFIVKIWNNQLGKYW